nr:MAG TPA: hypothetical protein [Caudoviricetes sp.]
MLDRDNTIVEKTDFNFWNLTSSNATENTEFDPNENNSNYIFVKKSETRNEGTFGDVETHKDYYGVRKSNVYYYRTNYKCEIGIQKDSIRFYDIGQQLVFSNLTNTTEEIGINKFKSENELNNYFKNAIGPGDVRSKAAAYYQYNENDNSYTLVIAIESDVVVRYILQDEYNSSMTENDFPLENLKKSWANHSVYVKANVYKFTEKEKYELLSSNKNTTNDNSYTSDSEFINDKIRITYTIEGKQYTTTLGNYNCTRIQNNYFNGKKIVTIEIPMLKLYNDKGAVVNDKKVFRLGQKFELKYLKNNNSSNYTDVVGITFVVIGVEFTYNGIAKMKIVGKEA